MPARPFPTPHRAVVTAAGVVAIAAVLAGCGGGSSKSNNRATLGSGEAPSGSGSAAPNFASAIGMVTTVNGEEASIKTSSGRKHLAFSPTLTRFSRTAATTRAALKVGDCIRAVPVGKSPSRQPTPGATPSIPTSMTAKAVMITSTTSCVRPSFSRGPNPLPSGGPGLRNGYAQNFGGGSGPPRGFRGGFAPGAIGTVTAVTGSTIVVKSSFGNTTTTVITTGTTTYDVTMNSTVSALRTGLCLTAIGSTASDGTLDARIVSLSPAVNGNCPAAAVQFDGFGIGGGNGG